MKKILTILYSGLCALALLSCSGKSTPEGFVINSLDDLKGKDIASMSGSVQDLLVSERCPESNILRAESTTDVLMMVETGKACATVYSDITWRLCKNNFPNVTAVGDLINPSPVGIGFNKDRRPLLEEFNLFLEHFLAENDLDALIDEWSAADCKRQMPDPTSVSGENGTLHFASAAIIAPFDFVRNGEVVGVEPEILARFAASKGMKWDFVDVTFSGLINYIVSGKADAGCAFMCITAERQQSIDFSAPWTKESSIILVNKNYAGSSSDVISSLEDVNGKAVAVLSGSVQDIILTEKCPDSKIMRTDSDADVFTMLEGGKVQAALHDKLSWSMAKGNFKDIVQVGEEIAPVPIGFAFRKENSALREKFDAFLADWLKNNDLDQVIQEWADPSGTRKMPSADEVNGDNGTLHFACAAITPPFDFIKDGEISGIEVELLAQFAKSLGMKWDFVDITFSGLINYIQVGKADAGCSIICITPERKESIDFSIPLLNDASVLLVPEKYAPAGLACTSGEIEKESFLDSLKASLRKSLVAEKRWKMLLEGLKATVIISLLAALLGTLLGMLLCYLSMRRNKWVAGLTNGFIDFMRCMPQVVFLMIMFYVVFAKSDINGLWVAVIAFALCFAAYTSVIFRTSVLSIDKGQTEAALSMGFSKVKAFINVILPQTVQRALPVYKGEFIGLVKATSIVGYIAVFDLTKAGDVIRSRTYEAFFPLILVTVMYFLVIWVLSISLKYVEAKTQPKRKKFCK